MVRCTPSAYRSGTLLGVTNSNVPDWKRDLHDLRLTAERGWTETNFTEGQLPFVDLENLCQVRQFNLETLETLSENELGYIAGRVDPDERLLGFDPASSVHTSATRSSKLKGNAARAQFILEQRRLEGVARRSQFIAILAAVVSASLTAVLTAALAMMFA